MLWGLHLIDVLPVNILYLNILTMKLQPYRHLTTSPPVVFFFKWQREEGDKERGREGKRRRREWLCKSVDTSAMEIHQLPKTYGSGSSMQSFQLQLKLGEQTDCFRRKYEMKIGKSEELNPVVHGDHHCTPPPHVFSHIFCDLILKVLLFLRGILFLFYRWGNRQTKST